MAHYMNLMAEMARNNLKKADVAESIGVADKTFNNKLSGVSDFTFTEIVAIRDTFFPRLTLDYLFEKKQAADPCDPGDGEEV